MALGRKRFPTPVLNNESAPAIPKIKIKSHSHTRLCTRGLSPLMGLCNPGERTCCAHSPDGFLSGFLPCSLQQVWNGNSSKHGQQLLWKILLGLKKSKNRTTMWSINRTFGYISKKKPGSQSYICSYSRYPRGESNRAPLKVDGWTSVAGTFTGIVFCPEKEGNMRYNIDEPWGHYTQWHKPITKTHCVIPPYEVSLLKE